MSTEDQLPTVADTTGAIAIAARIAGAIEADAAAFAGKLTVAAPDRGHAPPSQLEPRQLEAFAQAAANVWNELQTTASITPEQLEYARPVLTQFREAVLQARQAGDRAELRRLAHNLGCDLVAVGAITVSQRDLMRPILARFNPRAAELLRSLPVSRQSAIAGEVDEMRGLNQLIADPGSRYWKGPNAAHLQARWRELYDQGVRGDALPPTAPDRIEARMAELEKLMRNSSSEYHRGRNAAALQREYRDLVDQRVR